MNRRIWIWVTAIVAIVAAVLIIAALRSGRYVSQTATQSPVIGIAQAGEPAPEFTALTTSGIFDLNAVHRPTFLEVFATWCPHCQRETAVIDRLYEKYKGRVAFVAVSGHPIGMDGQTPSGPEDVLLFRSRFHVLYPIAYDGSLTVAKEYLQGGFPTLAIITRNKRVAYIASGEVRYSVLDRAITAVLK